MLKVSKRKTKTGCILWKGKLTKKGYGNGLLDFNGERITPHRMAYLIYFGKFNKKLFICHLCDNRACVNPLHLYAGTHQDNMRDRRGKSASLRKLTNRQINAIIKRLKNKESGYVIANIFSISPTTVYKIKRKYIDFKEPYRS